MAAKNSKVIVLSATHDKETKSTHRYVVDENEYGVSGALYMSKKSLKTVPSNIAVKIKTDE